MAFWVDRVKGAILFATVAACFATAAHAEVYEVGGNGIVTEISPHPVPPRPVVQPQTADASALPYRAHIAAAANRYGLAPELVDAVAWWESRYHARARSPAGALGVMQLMPATARHLGVANPLDPKQNITGGAAYLRAQLDRFGGDLSLALAAYNAGPEAVARYGTVPPYRETRAYVRGVLGRLAATIPAPAP